MCLNTNICTSNENITSISCNAYNVYKIRRIFPNPTPSRLRDYSFISDNIHRFATHLHAKKKMNTKK